jgi:GTPase SAR1 family protein
MAQHQREGGEALEELKVMVVGASGVGKSAITMRLVTQSFVEDYDPTVEDLFRKLVQVDGTTYMLEILDTIPDDCVYLFPSPVMWPQSIST